MSTHLSHVAIVHLVPIGRRKLARYMDHDDLRRVVDQIKTLTEDADRAFNRLQRIVEQPTGAPAGDSESDLQ